jgi:hypothetical protein
MDDTHSSKQQLALGDADSEQSGDLVVVGRSSRVPPEAEKVGGDIEEQFNEKVID